MEKKSDNIIVGKEFPKKVIPLIKKANQSIDIIVFDWRWYPDQVGSSIQLFNNALVVAVKKGVKIRTITNLRATVDILKKLNFNSKKWSSKKLLHTKLMIIDNKIAIIGSHNYTMNAFNVNQEISILIEQPAFVDRLKFYFNNLWQL
jgi:phosphatidylserine/phosphatidylglycerophosphate/cardiolipin synthase-like enzyme